MKIKGDFVIRTWKNKDGYDIRALAINLGYAVKTINFKTQEIAEILDLTVRDFCDKFPVLPDKAVSTYPLEYERLK